MNFDRGARLQTFAWIGIGLAVLWLLYLLSPILMPFLLAAILAYICDPVVERLEQRRVPRALGAVLVIVGLIALLVLLVVILVPVINKEALALAERLPKALIVINERLAPWLKQHFDITLQLDAASLRELLTENWDSAQTIARQLLQQLRIGGLALLGLVANLVLMPVVMFYLLRDWGTLLERMENAIPRPWRERVTRMAREIDAVLAEFLRGQLSVMMLLAIYYSIGLWLAGSEFALPVGILTGLLIFIPYLGFGLGFALALVVATLQFQGWGPIVGVLIVYGIGQLVESFVLTPWLVGERIGLHPLAVIFALLAFGQLFGFFGVLLALPASAALLVGLREVRAEYIKSPFYTG